MAIMDLYSKRQKRVRGDVPDVYSYTEIPQPLRVQIVQIWRETLGSGSDNEEGSSGSRQAYDLIVRTLRREYAVFQLAQRTQRGGSAEELISFFLGTQLVEEALDAIELSFKAIDQLTRTHDFMYRPNASEHADDAINELNGRFKEHGIGYQFVGGEIVRVDSQLLHAEVVVPALRLLNQTEYAGAQEEFQKAHEHYRHGRPKEAMNECLKSFESLMKSICTKHKWTFDPGATASTLVKICIEKDLIPSYWQSQYNALTSLLTSSVPTGRNKVSAHGQGASPTTVSDHLVAYVLHMTAASIVFLAETEYELP
jgi:AbiJ N-terminal domain 4